MSTCGNSLTVIARKIGNSATSEIEYDPSEGIEVLTYQLLSLMSDCEGDPTAIDYAGRVISCDEDITDVVESIQYSHGKELKRIVNLWYLDSKYSKLGEICSRMVVSSTVKERNGSTDINSAAESIIQPCYRIVDTPFQLCERCAKLFDSSLLVCDSTELNCFTCESDKAIETGLCYPDSASLLEIEKTEISHIASTLQLFIKRKLMCRAFELQVRSISNPQLQQSLRGFEPRISKIS